MLENARGGGAIYYPMARVLFLFFTDWVTGWTSGATIYRIMEGCYCWVDGGYTAVEDSSLVTFWATLMARSVAETV